jgi:hypothetical protein
MRYKAVAPFVMGVDAQYRPQAIDPNAFLTLEQFRIHRGTVTPFPGWNSVLHPGGVGPYGTMLKEFITLAGSSHILMAGPDKVYTYDPETKTVTDISAALVFGASRNEPWWPFFFNDSIYFTQKNDGLHKWNITGNVVHVPEAPKGKVGGVIAAHLCLFNVSDIDGDHPQRFQWASEATDDDWIAAPNNDAGYFDISESGDIGIGALPLQDDLVLYKEQSIIQIAFIGGNEVFGRRYTLRNIGLLGSYAVLDVGGEHILMGQDTFYTYSGGNVSSDIGVKIRDRVYNEIDLSKRARIRSVYMQETREALFFYPSNTSTQPDADKCVIYSTQEKLWYGPFNVQCSMAGRTTKNATIVVDSILDIADTVATIVNNYPTGADSHPRTLFIDDVGDLQEFGMEYSANGAPITRILETGDQFLGITATDGDGNVTPQLPEAVFQVAEVNLEFNFLEPDKLYELWLVYRMSLEGLIRYAGPYPVRGLSFTDGSNEAVTGRIKVPVRASGRWFRIKFVAPNSQRATLAGYQYGFNMVGRR